MASVVAGKVNGYGPVSYTHLDVYKRQGWGAELARLWKKPVFVFDQERKAWFAWNGSKWELCVTPPSITRENFAGLGTQNLTEDGKRAIHELYARSFGASA